MYESQLDKLSTHVVPPSHLHLGFLSKQESYDVAFNISTQAFVQTYPAPTMHAFPYKFFKVGQIVDASPTTVYLQSQATSTQADGVEPPNH